MENKGDTTKRAAALTQQGVDLFFSRRFDDALSKLEEALQLEPGNARAYGAKALCFLELGRPHDALALADKAVSFAPGGAVPLSVRGLCRRRLGDDKGALADFQGAIELDPTEFRVYYNLACYWAERGAENDCREALESAAALAPGHFRGVISSDPDLARYSGRDWFRDILVLLKGRYTDAPL